MPTDWLKVPHHRQSQPGYYLPAYVRMVLAFWQQEISESELVQILGTRFFGTPAPNIRRLSRLGFEITYESGTLAQIRVYLGQGIPCLLFVQTGNLLYWQDDAAHAVVVVGINESTILLLDPAFDDEPKIVSLDSFLLSWSEFDHRYAVIQRA